MKSEFWVSSSYFNSSKIEDLILKAKNLNIFKIELSAGLNFDNNIKNKIIDYEKQGFEFLIHNYFPQPIEDFVINLGSLDLENQKKTLEHCKSSINLASKLKNKIYTVHSGFAFEMNLNLLGNMTKQKNLILNNSMKIDKSLENMITNSNKLLNYADSLGVSVYFENNMIPDINYQNVNQIPYHLIEPNGIKEFFNSLDYKNTGLILDVAHAKIVSKILNFNPQSYFDLQTIKLLQLSEPHGYEDTSNIFNKNSWFYENLNQYPYNKLILEIRYQNFQKVQKLMKSIKIT